jgi:hypothetical protein
MSNSFLLNDHLVGYFVLQCRIYSGFIVLFCFVFKGGKIYFDSWFQGVILSWQRGHGGAEQFSASPISRERK